MPGGGAGFDGRLLLVDSALLLPKESGHGRCLLCRALCVRAGSILTRDTQTFCWISWGRLLRYTFRGGTAFTYVTACMVAKSPGDPLHRRLQQLRCLHCC